MQADAVVFTRKNCVEFTTIECPDPGPDDVVIRLTHSWISNGTEGSYLRGERINGDRPYRSGDPTPFPLVPGYQRVGVIEHVGSNIDDLTTGQLVFSSVGKVSGMFHPLGGHVSPSVTSRDCVWPLPGTVEPVVFSGLLLAQVGFNCGSRAPLPGTADTGRKAVSPQNARVLVAGDGLVGQWTVQTLRWRGAQTAMAGIDPQRLATAQRLTSCQTFDVTDSHWPDAVRQWAHDGLTMAVDTVGSREMTERFTELLDVGGSIVSAGFCGNDDRISLQSLRDKELTVYSVSGSRPERMARTLELVSDGTLRTAELITHRLPASEAARAWDIINTRQEHVLGVVLDW